MTSPRRTVVRRTVVRRPPARGNDRYLLPFEKAEIETRRHWMILMPAFLKSLAIITVGVLFISDETEAIALDNVALLVIVGGLIYLAFEVLQWWYDTFIVTDRRVLLVSGILTKKAAIMPLLKVTDMTFQQNPLGRMLRYGTFIFESAGQDQALSRVTHLPGGPRQLYLKISSLLFATYTTEPEEPPPPKWVAEQVAAERRRAAAQQRGDDRSGRINQTEPIPPIPQQDSPFAPGSPGDD